MPNQHVQVCFMTDRNVSMKNVIGAFKDQFGEILEDIQNQYPTTAMEVAFVAYAGVPDIPSDAYAPFTEDWKTLQTKVKNTHVSNGFETDCRMVVEGYALVANLKWRFAKRILFHMGNAPAHGTRYHEKTLNDPFTSGHPYWTLEEQIQKLAANRIDVVILKISKTTTMMEKVLENSYKEVRQFGFYVVDLTGNMNAVDDAVYATVKSHILRVMA